MAPPPWPAGGSSLYAATVQLPAGLLRQLYREAGVRLYSETDQVYTYVNHAIIGVYNATEEAAELPVSAEGEWPDLLTGERFTAENGRLRLPPRRCAPICSCGATPPLYKPLPRR